MNRNLSKYEIYGFWGIIRLSFSVLWTKLFFPGSRLIRVPIDVRGKRFIDFGTNLTTGFNCRIEAFPLSSEFKKTIKFGNNVQINDYVHISGVGSVTIGNDVLIASKIFISDNNHGKYDHHDGDSPLTIPIERRAIFKPVVLFRCTAF